MARKKDANNMIPSHSQAVNNYFYNFMNEVLISVPPGLWWVLYWKDPAVFNGGRVH
jgi:hypothetical protein